MHCLKLYFSSMPNRQVICVFPCFQFYFCLRAFKRLIQKRITVCWNSFKLRKNSKLFIEQQFDNTCTPFQKESAKKQKKSAFLFDNNLTTLQNNVGKLMKMLSFLHTVVVNNDKRRSVQLIETDDYVISSDLSLLRSGSVLMDRCVEENRLVYHVSHLN